MDIRQIYELAAAFIATLGFPIFIAIWLIVRDWKVLGDLRNSNNDLSHSLDRNTIMLDALIAALDDKTRPKEPYRTVQKVTHEIQGFRVQD